MAANKYAVESIGTFFLVTAIGMSTIDPGGAGAFAPVAIAATLIAMIYAGGHISGAHYNPAVTAAVTIRGKCFVADAIPYIVAQCVGAAAAAFLVLFLKGGVKIEPKTFVPIPALVGEALFTFALAFVVLNVATAKANANNSHYGVAIGLVVLAGALCVGPISGGVFNPAVTLALGLWGAVHWPDLGPHLFGQFAGAVLAAIAFKIFVKE
ncbi:MAG: aquaporin [Phycisphaerales bacterium]|nr:aquaporin [Phycisphaerales bacterium]